MPETDLETARQKLESLRAGIYGTQLQLNTQSSAVSVSISAGLAEFPDDGTSDADLLAAADARLFQTKREGRNRVVVSLKEVAV